LSELPNLPDDKWTGVSPDPRGALITGRLTQTVSGDANTIYLRARFDAGTIASRRYLCVSTADKLDVWVNGYYRGTIAPEEYIWRDHLHSDEHAGARLSFTAQPGINTVLFRVHGDRFAGGGFFADLQANC
jgi:hypothetical protein